MNKSLARIHLGLAILYGLVATVLCAIHLTDEKASAMGVLVFAGIFGPPLALHYAALRGVRAGQLWGRTLSRALGILLLLAIPIGTILGTFILLRTRHKDWQNAALR